MHGVAEVILPVSAFFLVVVLVEHLARRWALPTVGLLLIVGLGYGLVRRFGLAWLPEAGLPPDIVVFVFLPVLIFSSSRKLPVRALLAEAPEIAYLSLVGAGISMVLLALPLVLWGGVGWLHGLLFGTALAATDPLAVGAMLKRMHVPRRLLALIEGESLLNDAVVIVLFAALTGAVLGKTELSPSSTAGGFAYALLGGVALGVFAGGLVGGLLRIGRDMHDRFIGAVLPLVMVYGTFALAHGVLNVSGVIAVVAATLTLNALHTHRKRPTDAQKRSDDFFEDFWGFIDTLANAVLFFSIGAMVGQHEWLLSWVLVPLACLALLASRLATVYPMGLALAPARRHVPHAWRHAITASGLRGGLSVALLLTLPASYPHRIAMLCLALALLLFSLASHLAVARLYLRGIDFSASNTLRKEEQNEQETGY